jgi:non-lysosomal glucosylceramidase
VHFRDDGSPEHNYVPAHRPLRRASATAGSTQAGLQRRRCSNGEIAEPIAEGQGQWCMAVPTRPPGRPGRLARSSAAAAGTPPAMAASCGRASAATARSPTATTTAAAGADDPASAALAVQLPAWSPGRACEIPVVISWDLPVTAFATGSRALRRYTDFF